MDLVPGVRARPMQLRSVDGWPAELCRPARLPEDEPRCRCCQCDQAERRKEEEVVDRAADVGGLRSPSRGMRRSAPDGCVAIEVAETLVATKTTAGAGPQPFSTPRGVFSQ